MTAPPNLAEHGPAVIHADVPQATRWQLRMLVRMSLQHCDGCAAWARRRDRLRRIHTAYSRRARRG